MISTAGLGETFGGNRHDVVQTFGVFATEIRILMGNCGSLVNYYCREMVSINSNRLLIENISLHAKIFLDTLLYFCYIDFCSLIIINDKLYLKLATDYCGKVMWPRLTII